MTNDTKKFFQFIGAILGLGLIGGLIVAQNPPRVLALPLGIAWIIVFLGVTGFIVDGKKGAKDLVSTTLLTWAFIIIGAGLLLWLAIAGADHNL